MGLEPRAGTAPAASVLARAGVRRDGPAIPELRMVTVRPLAGTTVAASLRALRGVAGIRYVEVEHRARFRATLNDPALTMLETAPGVPANTESQWWARRSGFFDAWAVTRGEGAKVAVIDSGVDGGHPELSGKIADGVDLDGEAGHGGPTVDENGHGTHVSSIACAASGNGIGIAGAGVDCKLIVIKTDLTDASVAQSIVEATNRGAHAVNMSFGSDGRQAAAQAIVDAINRAVERDVVLVAAASDTAVEEQGDPASVLQPTGSGPDLNAGKGLTVTAANIAGQRASFAGRGTQISMAAFGQLLSGVGPPGILAAFPGNTPTELESGGSLLFPSAPCGCRTTFAGDSRFAYLQGTSMAAPMVAATAAMIRTLNPDLKAPEIIRMLKETAGRPAGSAWTPELGWGILDAGRAVRVARAIDRRAPTSRLRGPRSVRGGATLALRWRGSDKKLPGLKPSGIKLYDVYRSTGRGPYRRIAHTRRNRANVKTRPGVRYRFYTRAVDRVGNVEPVPARPDLSIRAGG